MIFTPIASSSKGNCYIVEHNGSLLLIEAGIPIGKLRRILTQMDLNLTDFDGVLISHEHGDHSKSVYDLIGIGIDVYMSQGTAEALSVVADVSINIIESKKYFQIGDWQILAFDTIHDANEPLGFLIANGDDKLLFCTDTGYLKYRFQGITHLCIECNYDTPLVEASSTHASVKNRLYGTHMSLNALKVMLQANDLSSLREIHLLHLSSSHSDVDRFKMEIEKMTGVPTYVAPE